MYAQVSASVCLGTPRLLHHHHRTECHALGRAFKHEVGEGDAGKREIRLR